MKNEDRKIWLLNSIHKNKMSAFEIHGNQSLNHCKVYAYGPESDSELRKLKRKVKTLEFMVDNLCDKCKRLKKKVKELRQTSRPSDHRADGASCNLPTIDNIFKIQNALDTHVPSEIEVSASLPIDEVLDIQAELDVPVRTFQSRRSCADMPERQCDKILLVKNGIHQVHVVEDDDGSIKEKEDDQKVEGSVNEEDQEQQEDEEELSDDLKQTLRAEFRDEFYAERDEIRYDEDEAVDGEEDHEQEEEKGSIEGEVQEQDQEEEVEGSIEGEDQEEGQEEGEEEVEGSIEGEDQEEGQEEEEVEGEDQEEGQEEGREEVEGSIEGEDQEEGQEEEEGSNEGEEEQEQPVAVSEEEGEEVELYAINGVNYYITNKTNGIIYAAVKIDGEDDYDIGEVVGVFAKGKMVLK